MREKQELWDKINEAGKKLREATGKNPFDPVDHDERDRLNLLCRNLNVEYFKLVGLHWPRKV